MILKSKRNERTCFVKRCRQPSVGIAESASFFSDRGGDLELCEKHLLEANQMALNQGKQLVWRAMGAPAPAPEVKAEVVETPNPQEDTKLALHQETEKEKQQAQSLLEQCSMLQVRTKDEVAFVAQVLAEIKGETKRLTARQKEVTDPLNQALKAARALFKPALELLGQCEAKLKDHLALAHQAAEAEKRAALQAAHEQAVAGDTKAAGQAIVKAEAAAELPQTEGVSYRSRWVFAIVNADIVPREYCSPDLKKIREVVALQKGATNIPGVAVREDTQVASRSAT